MIRFAWIMLETGCEWVWIMETKGDRWHLWCSLWVHRSCFSCFVCRIAAAIAMAISELTGYIYGIKYILFKWGFLIVLITGITWAITVRCRPVFGPTFNVVLQIDACCASPSARCWELMPATTQTLDTVRGWISWWRYSCWCQAPGKALRSVGQLNVVFVGEVHGGEELINCTVLGL